MNDVRYAACATNRETGQRFRVDLDAKFAHTAKKEAAELVVPLVHQTHGVHVEEYPNLMHLPVLF